MTETMLHLGFGLVPAVPGPHVGVFFRSLAERDKVLKSFLETGLDAGDPCVFLTPREGRSEYMAALRKAGLPVAKAVKSGQLQILDCEDFYLEGGRFDPDRVIAKEREQLKRLPGGKFLRAAGDMSWALYSGVSADEIARYERRLNQEILPFCPLAALCLYDMRRFGFAWGKAGYDTHPHIVFGEHFFENTRYQAT